MKVAEKGKAIGRCVENKMGILGHGILALS
jgi:hypothetical protein